MDIINLDIKSHGLEPYSVALFIFVCQSHVLSFLLIFEAYSPCFTYFLYICDLLDILLS